MFLLTNQFKDTFDFEDNTLHVDMSFDNILRLFELFDDPDFENSEKVLIALEILVVEYTEFLEELNFIDQYNIYKYLMKEFLDTDIEGKVKKSNEDDKVEDKAPSVQSMDFSKDAGVIYVSFLSEFKIDLFEMHGKLHFDKFSELLRNLNEKSVFKEIVSYRTMKVPSIKETSKEYREHVIQMKRLHSLEDEEYQQVSAVNKLDTIASSFGGGSN